MANPHACPDCLRRSHLLALLTKHIDKLALADATNAWLDLLRLPDRKLVDQAAPQDGDQLLARVAALGEKRLQEDLAAANCWATCPHDDRFYPEQLREQAGAPGALVGLGDPACLDGLSAEYLVTFAGAKRTTSYGRQVARHLSRELMRAGLTVVAPFDTGIGSWALYGALNDHLPTIAVIDSGPDIAYPDANRPLWQELSERGAILSELPPGTTPLPWTYPAAHRIMAALAGMTLVIEGTTKSKALVAADVAGDLGRIVGAVPGPITSPASAGPNALLAAGARVVRDTSDVLEALHGARGLRQPPDPDPWIPVCPECATEDIHRQGWNWKCGNCGNTFETPLWAES